MNDHVGGAEDRELLDALRASWEQADPVPAGLADRMIAAVTVDDLSREFALLSLVDGAQAAVRAGDERRTLQFADDDAEVLLHVSPTDGGARRIDGWSRPAVLAARLARDDAEWAADTVGDGRFSFEGVAAGRAQVRMVVRQEEGLREVVTPWFDM
ncbi:hypothetical protein [Microbacterium sp. KNMS]